MKLKNTMSDSFLNVLGMSVLTAYLLFSEVCLWAVCVINIFVPSHRLAADLSPDTLEESEESTPSSSTSSSSEEEELKLKLYQETLAHGHNTRHQNYRFPAGSATAAPASASTKSAKDIYNQGHVTDVTSSPFEASTSGSSSTSSQPPSVTSSAFTVDNGNLCGEKTDGVEKCYEELNCNQASDSATRTAEPATSEEIPVPQAGEVQSSVDAAKKPARHGTKRSADDTTSPSFDRGPPCSIEKGHHDVSLPEDGGSAREDGNDDDDDESIEDVSISHNVPMCPSPPPLSPVRSPLVSRRVMEAAEEMGGASGSSSDSDGSALAKCSGMRLDIQKVGWLVNLDVPECIWTFRGWVGILVNLDVPECFWTFRR